MSRGDWLYWAFLQAAWLLVLYLSLVSRNPGVPVSFPKMFSESLDASLSWGRFYGLQLQL